MNAADANQSQQLLDQWNQVFKANMQSQPSVFEVLDEQLAVEHQTLIGTPINPSLQLMLQEAVFDRAFEGWRSGADAEHHEMIEIVIESVHARLMHAYEDYLRQHWITRPSDLAEGAIYDARIAGLLNAHLQDMHELLLAELDSDARRMGIQALDEAWRGQALAGARMP
ncbi:hypothetical protein ACIPZF_07240 [Pseudomonas sp. NPDC089752]|uniref:hypothetical protein n=1 Tax=Pseudomonas sp. NPDC089752 TaxID=3364472 RepID=UPI003830777C